MSDEAVREFFCVEFNHPVRGWTLLPDLLPCGTHEHAQACIVHRLRSIPKTRRESGAQSYRIVRYSPEVIRP